MELVLARDSVNQILGYLSHQELHVYGSVAKMCNKSAEMEWKRRLNKYESSDHFKQTEDPNFWRKKFRSYIHKQYESVQFDTHLQTPNFQITEGMKKACELLVRLPELRQLLPYRDFVLQVKTTLVKFWYDLNFEMFEFAQKYFDLLFPQEYLKRLAQDLYPEAYISGREESDEFLYLLI